MKKGSKKMYNTVIWSPCVICREIKTSNMHLRVFFCLRAYFLRERVGAFTNIYVRVSQRNLMIVRVETDSSAYRYVVNMIRFRLNNSVILTRVYLKGIEDTWQGQIDAQSSNNRSAVNEKNEWG